jgi:pantetheine-phosphate adenylyltransferase
MSRDLTDRRIPPEPRSTREDPTDFGRRQNAGGRQARIAVCPGTFDPVTYGHLDVVDRASKVFDWIVVGVVDLQVRKQRHLFSGAERKSLIEEALVENEIANVEVRVFSNLLVEFARNQGATAIIRGLRAISDFEYEFELNQLNRILDPDIESIYLFAAPEYSFIRASGIRELAMFGRDASELVPPNVAAALAERLGGQAA